MCVCLCVCVNVCVCVFCRVYVCVYVCLCVFILETNHVFKVMFFFYVWMSSKSTESKRQSDSVSGR